MLWQPPKLWTKLAKLIVLSADVRLVWKATTVAVLQVLWRMVQLRYQRLLPDVPRLAMRQLPLLHVIDVSLIWLLYFQCLSYGMTNSLQIADNCTTICTFFRNLDFLEGRHFFFIRQRQQHVLCREFTFYKSKGRFDIFWQFIFTNESRAKRWALF